MEHIVEVRRSDLNESRVSELPPVQLKKGQVRLAVATFGLTANNITYAVFGDGMRYWDFFPAPSGTGWGVVPVWGFADVAESTVPEIAKGERIYGYLPMGTELISTPGRISDRAFTDAAEHRTALPGTYNNYTRCAADPAYSAKGEDMQMLLQPLFVTSFLIDDFLEDNEFFGASQVILTSASSKTGFGTAHLLKARGSVKVVGLTSPGNVEFSENLGWYDDVVPYDQIKGIADEPSVLLDFAGNANVVRAVHEHLGDSLQHSAAIGGTHWDADRPEGHHPGPRQEFFFAPSQVEKRAGDWGGAELQKRINTAWVEFMPLATSTLSVESHAGIESARALYHATLAGAASASAAPVIRL